MADQQWITEDQVAERLGIDREKIRAERPRLKAGEVSRQGNAIVWLRSAAARVAKLLGLQPSFLDAPPPNDPSEKNGPGGQPLTPDGEEVSVHSVPGPGGWHFPNHNIVRVKRASGELVYVRVTDSRKFFARLRTGQPMTFRAKRAPSGNWWVMTGREPRFPGMW